MGISTDQGVNINLAQNVTENALNHKIDLFDDKLELYKDQLAARVSEKDGEKGLGKELIADTMRKLADADVTKLNQTIQKKATEAFKQEIDSLFQKEDLGQDKATFSEAASRNLSENRNLRQLKNTILSRNNFFSSLSSKQKALMESYVSAFQAAVLEENNPQIRGQGQGKKFLEQLEEQLEQEGMDTEGKRDFKNAVRETVSYAGAQKQQKMNQLYENGRKFFDSKVSARQKELLSEFIDTYPQVLLQEEKQAYKKNSLNILRERMQQMEQRMEEAGISKDEIVRAKQSIENEVAAQEADKKRSSGKKQAFKGNRFFAKSLSERQKVLVQEYTSFYPRYLQSSGKAAYETGYQRISERIKQLERQLQQEGMSTQQLQDLKVQIRYSIRSELLSQVKDAFIERLLQEKHGDKDIAARISHLTAKRKENFLHKFAFGQSKLGGQDFGGYRGGIKGATEFAVYEGYNELSAFAKEEIINALIRAKADPDKGNEELQLIEKLAYIANRTGTSMNELNSKMKTMMDDLGYVDFTIEDYGAGAGGEGSDRERRPDYGEYNYTEDDEKEILINRYKALLMKRAIYPDSKTYLETAFKLRSTKKGLVRLGIFSPEFEENISEEARKAAVEKLLDMLKEALIERSSFFQFEGPAYSVTEKKIKSILKNMQKLECPLSEEEYTRLRDQANSRMFDLSNRELQMVNLAYKNNRHPFYVKKRQMLIKLLERIKAESSLPGAISYEDDVLSAMESKGSGGQGFSMHVWDDVRTKLNEVKYLYQNSDIFTGVLQVVCTTLENIRTIQAEAVEQDIKTAEQYLKQQTRIREELDDELLRWCREVRTMLYFISRNDKTCDKSILKRLIALLDAVSR